MSRIGEIIMEGGWRMKKFIQRYGGWIAAFALIVTTVTANSACVWASYQPVVPENAKKLRKF